MALSSGGLDLSQLPSPSLVDVDFERSFDERKVRLVELLNVAGFDTTVQDLETDPYVILQRADNIREMLSKLGLNDVFRQTLVAFATGAALDHVGATLHFLRRMSGEGDERYRFRLQLESENKAGGRLAGYIAEAMKVSLDVYKVGAWVDRSVRFEPTVRLAIQIENGTGAAPQDLVSAVQQHIDRDDVRQATDVVVAQSVSVSFYSIDVRLIHAPGPDPSLLRSTAKTALEVMVGNRWSPRRGVPRAAVIGAAMVAGVERLDVITPPADVIVGFGELATCQSVSVTSEIAND